MAAFHSNLMQIARFHESPCFMPAHMFGGTGASAPIHPAARPEATGTTTMWTLIKGSFWFSMVLVLLPVFHSGSSERLANAPPVDFTDAYSVATGAYDYISNLCTEKPDVCEKGGKTFTALGYRAKEGARVAYEYLNTKFSDDPAALAAAKAPETADTVSSIAALAEAALATAAEDKTVQAAAGAVFQPMPHKPQPYRPPVADTVITGTVQTASEEAMPAHVPVPLPRPYPES
jgi:hypothetical protein